MGEISENWTDFFKKATVTEEKRKKEDWLQIFQYWRHIRLLENVEYKLFWNSLAASLPALLYRILSAVRATHSIKSTVNFCTNLNKILSNTIYFKNTASDLVSGTFYSPYLKTASPCSKCPQKKWIGHPINPALKRTQSTHAYQQLFSQDFGFKQGFSPLSWEKSGNHYSKFCSPVNSTCDNPPKGHDLAVDC